MNESSRRWLWSFPVVLVLGVIGYFTLLPSIAPRSNAQSPTLTRIVALGRLEPAGGVLRLAGTPGDRIDQILVKEGVEVEENADLIRFSSYRVAEAEKKLLVAQRMTAKEHRTKISGYGKAELDQADERIRQLTAIEPLERKAATVRIEILRKQRDIAAEELKRFQGVAAVPAQQVAQQQSLYDKAVGEYDVAVIAREKGELEAIQTRALAILNRVSAEKNIDRLLAEIPEPLEESLQLADLKMENGTLRAPSKGRILQLNARKGEVAAQSPLIQLADTSRMVVDTEVYETDIPLLRGWLAKGEVKASVTSKVLGDQKLTGKVMRVGSLIGRNQILDINPVADADRRVVEVRVLLDSPDPASQFINLQVTVELTPTTAP